MFHVKQYEDDMVQKHFGEGAYRSSALTQYPVRPSTSTASLAYTAFALITVTQVIVLPAVLVMAIYARLDFNGSEERAVGVIRAWLRMSRWPLRALRGESENANE